jgi:hypothetical protein
MKKFAFALVFTFAMVGYVLADDFNVTISKYDKDKNTITYTKNAFGGKGGKKGGKKGADQPAPEPVTMTVSKTVKVFKADVSKDDDGKAVYKDGEEVKSGLTDDVFTKMDEKGVTAHIYVADDGADKGNVTKILLTPFKGGKKKGGGN